ncbi:leucine-rich repeat extensin-like protein 5 [Helianthus annuus]|uniref:leucine-rich repeat extensin-like protein 5 n=1 Tax=Helianthus annuus TaxID=4232 RepID=UPI000B8FB066|nr:leucine-rich repeat extensin-like protein 5 [Helianthus annuus]
MPPRFFRRRGRGKGPITAPNNNEAGPSNARAPSTTESDDAQQNRRNLFEPARRSVSHSSTPPNPYGPRSDHEASNPQPSYIPLQRSLSHNSFGDPTPVFRGRFNPANFLQEPGNFNPLGPEDHFSGDHADDMDEDTDPVEPASGTPNHPIEISDGSSFHGSPYVSPDSFQAMFTRHEWYYTPPRHSPPQQQQQQQQDSPENPRFVAVTPPSPPPPIQPAPPQPPRRRRTGARISVRTGDFHFSSPRQSSASHYPPHQENPQMGGPSQPVAPQPPPMGFDNPIPAYTSTMAYNPFEPPVRNNYNYAEADPYMVTANYNTQGPYGDPWGIGYPTHGYPIPPRPIVRAQSQPPRFSPPEHEEILQRLDYVEREFHKERRERETFFQGLTSLIKGKSKKDR